LPETTEAVLLIAGIVFVLAGLAGGAVKAFNIEITAITGMYPRIGLVVFGALFITTALVMILRPASVPQAQSAGQDRLASTSTAIGDTPPEAVNGTAGRIGIGQTVTGTLYYNEANSWVFADGPATVNIVLDVGPFGEALILLFDPQGVEREYVDAQSGSEERMMFYEIPTAGEYIIAVRNTENTQADYRLSIERPGGGS
jgi:hypothetical protein